MFFTDSVVMLEYSAIHDLCIYTWPAKNEQQSKLESRIV